MPKLFTPTKIKNLTLANRFIRSATWEGLAGEDGACTPELVNYLKNLARGATGLIISGHAYVSQEGQATGRQLGIYSDSLIAGLRQMSDAVHQEGGTILIQLAHGGLRSASKLSGITPMGPSNGEELIGTPSREMTIDDIETVANAFRLAGSRAQAAGYDGIQIHAAHGYLLSQFLSPAFNRRTDTYGGKLDNRVRIITDIFQRLRRETGPDFPILIKINSQDFLKDGLALNDFIQVCISLDRAGIDAIEVSGGTMLSGRNVPFRKEITYERDQAYFRRAAKALKAKIKAPVILVGGIRSFFLAERLLDEEYADYFSMSRPFIREPGLIARWQSGDLRKASCISCNGCLGAARSGRGIRCVQDI